MNKANVHNGHRTRLKQKFNKHGIAVFEEHQLLELLLTYCIPRKDTNEIAHNLISTFGSVKGVLSANIDFLKRIQGVGDNSATFLSLIGSVCNKYSSFMSKPLRLNCSRDGTVYCINFMQNKTVEELYMICLDSNFTVVNNVKISSGDLHTAQISIRDILSVALSNNATTVLFTHNHPNLNAQPSVFDNDFTFHVLQQMHVCGIDVSDHVIVGKDSFYSYKNSGKLDEYKAQLNNMNNSNISYLKSKNTD